MNGSSEFLRLLMTDRLVLKRDHSGKVTFDGSSASGFSHSGHGFHDFTLSSWQTNAFVEFVSALRKASPENFEEDIKHNTWTWKK